MADNTKIEWTDATVNAVNGCSVVSPGCTNCYAMKLAGTRLRHHPSRSGLTVQTKGGPVWTGEVRLNEDALLQPLRWRRPRRIFWNAHGDLFHPKVPFEWVDRQFAVMALSPQHIHQVLTKRPDRMRAYFEGVPQPRWIRWMEDMAWEHPRPDIVHPISRGVLLDTKNGSLRNVWLGTSVEDQKRAEERIPHLLATPAAVRFLSCEPLLGPVDLSARQPENLAERICRSRIEASTGVVQPRRRLVDGIHWMIVGGESGPGARPMHPGWARSLRDQCAAAGVPFFFKQWGAWQEAHEAERVGSHWFTDEGRLIPAFEALPAPNDIMVRRVGKKAAGRLLDGVEHNGVPA